MQGAVLRLLDLGGGKFNPHPGPLPEGEGSLDSLSRPAGEGRGEGGRAAWADGWTGNLPDSLSRPAGEGRGEGGRAAWGHGRSAAGFSNVTAPSKKW